MRLQRWHSEPADPYLDYTLPRACRIGGGDTDRDRVQWIAYQVNRWTYRRRTAEDIKYRFAGWRMTKKYCEAYSEILRRNPARHVLICEWHALREHHEQWMAENFDPPTPRRRAGRLPAWSQTRMALSPPESPQEART